MRGIDDTVRNLRVEHPDLPLMVRGSADVRESL